MIVYYSPFSAIDTGLRFGGPVATIDVIKNQNVFFNKFVETGIINCPAFNDSIKNLFVTFAPFSINIKFDSSALLFRTTKVSQKEFESVLHIRDGIKKLLSLRFGYYLITPEKSLKMTFLPTYLCSNNFSFNTNIVTGTLDLGKWPRSTDLAFFLNKDVDIIEGDPLFFLKFHTNEKIIFKRFIATNNYINLSQLAINTRNNKNNIKFNLSKYYSYMFKYPKLKKLMLKEALDNCIE